MDMGYPVLFHFRRSVLNISTRTTTTGGVAGQFNLHTFIHGKGSFAILQRPETLASGTGVVPVAYDDSDSYLIHGFDYLALKLKSYL
jgi:hypothetical protein